MFTAKGKLFSSERGSATSWLAGITATALLIGTAALPAVADETVTPSEEQAVSQTAEPTAKAVEEPAALVEVAAPAEEAAPEAVIDEPLEDVAPAEEPAADDPATEEAVIGDPIVDESPASDQSEQPAADAPAVSEEPAATEESAQPLAEDPSTGASSTDGDTPDANSPPVEEFVPGIKVEATSDSATIAWPEFGFDDNYAVQMEKNDGTWKTLDAEVGDAAGTIRDYEATIDGLKPGKEYTVRIVTAETEDLAVAATEAAVDADVSGPGKGSMARSRVATENPNDPTAVVSNVVTFAAATGAPLDGGSTFEGGDGNLIVDDLVKPLVDWNSFSYSTSTGVGSGPAGFGFTAAIDRPAGSTDNIFVGGTSENDFPPKTELQSPQNKADLSRAYVATENKGGKTFLYLAWVREPSSDGSVTVSYELNQAGIPAANPAGCTPPDTGCSFPQRTNGDRLLTYDFSPSKGVTIDIRTWNGSWGPAQVPPANLVQAQVNAAPVDDTVLGGTTSLAADRFGEVALNLTDLIANPTNSCQGFGSVTVKTRSSNSMTAELKDFIGPKPIVVGNCKLEVAKVVIPGNDTGKFDLLINGAVEEIDATNGGTTGRVPVTTSVAIPVAERAGSGTDLSNYTTQLVCQRNEPNGESFTVTNTSLTGSLRDGFVQLSNGDDVLCIFTNTRTQNLLTLRKAWAANSVTGDQAVLTIAGGVASSVSETSTAPDAVTVNNATDQVRSGAQVTVSESVTGTGTYTPALECVLAGTSTVVSGSADGTFDMPNQAVVCTYTNTRTQNLLTLRKAWVNGLTGDQAVLTIAGGVAPATSTSTVPDAVTVNNASVQVRSGAQVTVSESVTGTGTYTPALECVLAGTSTVVSGSADGTFDMPNQAVVCTYTNTRTQELVDAAQGVGRLGAEGDQAGLTIAGEPSR